MCSIIYEQFYEWIKMCLFIHVYIYSSVTVGMVMVNEMCDINGRESDRKGWWGSGGYITTDP